VTAAELLRVIGHCAELVAEHEAARAILLRHAATLRLAEELATQDSQGVTRDTPAHQVALPPGAGQPSCAPGPVNPRPGPAADAAAGDRRGKGGDPAPDASRPRRSRTSPRLTPELQAEVARLAAAGLNGSRIARQLGLTTGTAYRAVARARAAEAARPAADPAPSPQPSPAPPERDTTRGGPQPAAVIRAWGLAHGARVNVMGRLDAEDLRRVNARRAALGLAPFVLAEERGGDTA
jgi:DNA-binding CsgD family transcriptional regulator